MKNPKYLLIVETFSVIAEIGLVDLAEGLHVLNRTGNGVSQAGFVQGTEMLSY